MEWGQQNNEIDHKKVFVAAVVLVAIALIASAVYYFAVFKNGDALPKGEPTAGQQLSEQEKAEIEKNLTADTPTIPLSKKEKNTIEKNFINSGPTLTEDEKRQIEKNFGL